MYKVLIVDDEKVERAGIKFLISEYRMELEVAEAGNGEKALEHMADNPVDILITDIRMPFMDGLELLERARQIRPGIKTVILSAYSEFEYAKKAIDLNVIHYILKPVEETEFLRVINNVINLCNNETNEKEKVEKISKGYHSALKYEKEKVLLDIIHGIEVDQQLRETINDFHGNLIQLAVINFKSQFFNINSRSFEILIKELVFWDYVYINLNEYESVIIFINSGEAVKKEVLAEFGEKLKDSIINRYNANVFIAFSEAANMIDRIRDQYLELENLLENRFFFDDSAVLFADMGFKRSSSPDETVKSAISNIGAQFGSSSLDMGNIIEMFFNSFNTNGCYSISPIYLKHACSDLVKIIYQSLKIKEDSGFRDLLTAIYKCDSLNQLMEMMRGRLFELSGHFAPSARESDRKVIKETVNYINENYMNNISVEGIAEKVFLSADYLSHLFKESTGQSLMKYITSQRLKTSAELLISTNMKIVDIGNKVGYPNLSYFCMIFKNCYGVSPAKYRERGRYT